MVKEDIKLVPYKDISELKKELEGLKDKKDVSNTDLYEAVQKLSKVIEGMLEVFGAAAEQLKLEEKDYDPCIKKHDEIISKLDIISEQNKSIAEVIVSIYTSMRGGIPTGGFQKELKPPFFGSRQTMVQPMQVPPQMQLPSTPPPIQQMTPTSPLRQSGQQFVKYPPNIADFNLKEMTPPPPPPISEKDLGLLEPFPLEEEKKKKGLFGVFKK